MAIPSLYQVTFPLLKLLGDQKEKHIQDIINNLANEFDLSEQERNEYLESGSAKRFDNRVRWALVELKIAELVKSPRRGFSHITERGMQVLKDNPETINRDYLKQFPEYLEKMSKNKDQEKDGPNGENGEVESLPPVELIDQGYKELRKNLASEILDKVGGCSWEFFENLVVKLLVSMGYGGSLKDAGEVRGKVGDEGIDGVIKEDLLGLDLIYVQAKKWSGPVGRPEIQKFAGALQGKRAKKGIFITTSSFTREAVDFAKGLDSKIILIDGEKLAEYMIDFNVGVSTSEVYELKKIDMDFFEME